MIAYNVHGLLTIESDRPLHNPAFHRYFEVESVYDPDIIVQERSFSFDEGRFDRHDIWYYGKPEEDVVIYDDTLFGQRDQVMLEGIEEPTTRITVNTLDHPNVTPRSRGSVNDLVESVIDWKLLRNGCTTIHSAALCRDGEAVMLAGFPNVGKTLSTLHLLQNGWSYMGDDNGVVRQDGTVFAYPSTSSVGYHDFLKFIEPGDIGRRRYYSYLARVWPMQNAIIERLFDYPEVYLPDIGFEQGGTARGSIAACLEIGQREIREETARDLTTKIVESTNYSRPRIWQNPFFHVWSYFNNYDLFRLQQVEWWIVRDHLKSADAGCYTLACRHRDWDDVLDEVVP